MAGITTLRRKQFSSCDSCRNSRVKCDALEVVTVEGIHALRESCSRCTKQHTLCTFNWVQKHKSHRARNRHLLDLGMSPVTQTEQAMAPRRYTEERRMRVDHGLHLNARSIHDTLWELYHQNFEAMLGTWIGACPCLDGYDMSAFRCDEYSKSSDGVVKGDTYLNVISITRLFVTLDKWVGYGQLYRDL
ncbi:hypothetical protein VE01_01660 [Pseudogymnoascus verrucosus]|uniref:Zn(2)-C6 fungal-type domain-containing protein n=1 Tax=Pseudogymnoascus verrucosus TaxID=342668 RepID=A0A1B8GX18_9PEZI|nr:uncharacterized protein VE01_01660 [Pseudogymnoascus verrucosus]OBU00351.1 hypothetical protein VE01_01660 [Pseudogymnoascus verrucosus]